MKSKVAVIKCKSYDEDEVYNALKKGLELCKNCNLFRLGVKLEHVIIGIVSLTLVVRMKKTNYYKSGYN